MLTRDAATFQRDFHRIQSARCESVRVIVGGKVIGGVPSPEVLEPHERLKRRDRQGHGTGRRVPHLAEAAGTAGRQYRLYARNFPLMPIFTRSPFWSGWRSRVMSKSIALMIPSPNSSWISSFQVVP